MQTKVTFAYLLVNVNALTHPINLKMLTRNFFLRKLIALYGLTSTSCRHHSAVGYLSLCDGGTANQCCQGSSTTDCFENSCGKNYRGVGCAFLGYFYNETRPPKVYIVGLLIFFSEYSSNLK